jgi:hypothetical protein
VLNRLVQLDVLRDPDEEVIEEDSESSELEEEFDYVDKAQARVQKFLMSKRSKKDKFKSVGQQMKQNDLMIMQKTLQKVIDHEKTMLKFKEFDVFNFISTARDHSIKVDETLLDIDK